MWEKKAWSVSLNVTNNIIHINTWKNSMRVHLVHIVNSVHKYDEFTRVRSYSLKLKTEEMLWFLSADLQTDVVYSIGVVSVFFLNKGGG